jgi:hypothetical protein
MTFRVQVLAQCMNQLRHPGRISTLLVTRTYFFIYHRFSCDRVITKGTFYIERKAHYFLLVFIGGAFLGLHVNVSYLQKFN